MALVDVCIPTRRHARGLATLPAALRQLARQTLPDIRVLVCDQSVGAPFDAEPAIADALSALRAAGVTVAWDHRPDLSWERFAERWGEAGTFVSSLPHARRSLLERSNAEFVLCMDDDILLGDEFVADMVAEARAHPAGYYMAFPLADARLWFNALFYVPVVWSPRAEPYGLYCHGFCSFGPRAQYEAVRAWDVGEGPPFHLWDPIVYLRLMERFGLPRLVRTSYRHLSPEQYAPPSASTERLGTMHQMTLFTPPHASASFVDWLTQRGLLPGSDLLPLASWRELWARSGLGAADRPPPWPALPSDPRALWSRFREERGAARLAVRSALFTALVRAQDVDLLAELSAEAPTLDAPGRYAWVEALSAARGLGALLRPFLDDPDDPVHWRALEALDRAGELAPSADVQEPSARALGDALLRSAQVAPPVARAAVEWARRLPGGRGVMAAGLVAAAGHANALAELWRDRAALHPLVRLAVGFLAAAVLPEERQGELVDDYLQLDEVERFHLLGGWELRHTEPAGFTRHPHLAAALARADRGPAGRARFRGALETLLPSSDAARRPWILQALARTGMTTAELAERVRGELPEGLAREAAPPSTALERPGSQAARDLLFHAGGRAAVDPALVARCVELLAGGGLDAVTATLARWVVLRARSELPDEAAREEVGR